MPSTKSRYPRIPVALFILAGLFAFALSYATAYWKKEAIELDLTQKVRKALAAANLPLVNINFEGRAANLAGIIPDESLKPTIEAAVAQVAGVRSISSQLKSLDSPAPETPHTVATFKDGRYIPPRDHPLEKYDLSAVQFIPGTADLTPESLPVLKRLAMLLKQYRQIQIELSVHTDNQGTALGQLAASEVRARTLHAYLLEQGVETKQLSPVGYGATRPVASNDSAAGRAKNRRVQLIVLKDG